MQQRGAVSLAHPGQACIEIIRDARATDLGEHGSHIRPALAGGRKEEARKRHLGAAAAPALEQSGEDKDAHSVWLCLFPSPSRFFFIDEP